MVLFHERLRALRQFRNLSIGQLAERVSIPKATLARWDSGEASPSIGSKHLLALADFFEMTLGELLSGGGA